THRIEASWHDSGKRTPAHPGCKAGAQGETHAPTMAIPLSQPDLTQREIDAVADVMRSGTLSIGPKLEEFERHVARISGRTYAVGVANGTCGLHLSMLAANIGPGDEVITTPFSFVA